VQRDRGVTTNENRAKKLKRYKVAEVKMPEIIFAALNL
jgi:hypothetical protein